MTWRSLIVPGLVILAVALSATPAPAKVTILDNDGKPVDTIKSGKCIVSGKKGAKDFFMAAKSESRAFSLTAFIDAPVFSGFRQDYTIYYGGEDPQVFLHRRADDAVFSNFKIPGTPPGTVGGGAIHFARHGRKVGIGLAPASNKSFTEGYVFAGGLNCKYPKRR